MRYNKRLTWFTAFYAQAADVFPLVVASPRYFMGQIPLGVLTQTAGAFGRVQGSLSWFVDVWPQLADWKATIDRLTTFGDSMAAARRVTQATSGFTVDRVEGGPLKLDDVEVALPDGRLLLEHVDLEVRPGDRLVIQGPSGSGKTTLFRVLAGLWPFGKGRIQLPEAQRLLFLPQKPYLPVGTLREALCFPHGPDAYDLVAIGEALKVTGLDHLTDRLDEERFWSPVLSPGSSSASRSPARCSSGPTGCSSTRAPRRSTRRWRRSSIACSGTGCPRPRSSASRTSRAWLRSTTVAS